jgi:hypothetical protein
VIQPAGGISAHVDLRSPNSLAFLAEFEGVEYATSGNITLAKVVYEMKPKLAKSLRARSLSQLKKIATQTLQALRRAGPNRVVKNDFLLRISIV